jgi:glycosyltransferase involved in cell wall biosynthesis
MRNPFHGIICEMLLGACIMEIKPKSFITVIVLSKNNADTLGACLNSVLKSSPQNKEVIVVDAHSTDGTRQILNQYGARIRVVYDEGKGQGVARNLGVQHASNAIIAFVDPDVICARDHFIKVLTYFNEHPEIAALDVNTMNYPNVGTKVQRLESSFLKTANSGITSQRGLLGWSIACRRSAFEAVGGFCKRGSEDNDLTFRLESNGFVIAHLRADSWHIPRRTLPLLIAQMKLWGRNVAYTRYRWIQLLNKDSEKRKYFKLLHNARAMSIVVHALAPIVGTKYLRKSKSLQLYLYFIVRQYAWLVGFFVGNLDITFKRKRYLETI